MISMLMNVDEAGGISTLHNVPWQYSELDILGVELTHGKTCVLGLSAYVFMIELLGEDVCLALNEMRETVVIAEVLELPDSNIKLAKTFKQAVELSTMEDVICVGSASVFRAALPFVEEVYLNTVPGNYNCNVSAPDVVEAIKRDFEKVNESVTNCGISIAKYRRRHDLW